MSLELDHLHIVISAHGLGKPPKSGAVVEAWLTRVAEMLNATVLIAPHAVYCTAAGNEGISAVMCLETARACIQCWTSSDSGPFLRADLYSCIPFEAKDILTLVAEFEPTDVGYTVLDRNGGEAEIIQSDWVMAEDEDDFIIP